MTESYICALWCNVETHPSLENHWYIVKGNADYLFRRERAGNTTKVETEENPRNIRFYLLAVAGKEINLAYLNSGGQVLAFAVAGGFHNVWIWVWRGFDVSFTLVNIEREKIIEGYFLPFFHFSDDGNTDVSCWCLKLNWCEVILCRGEVWPHGQTSYLRERSFVVSVQYWCNIGVVISVQ